MSNPYTTPKQDKPQPSSPKNPSGIVMAPAIALIVTAVLGLIGTALNIVVTLFVEPPPIDPTIPPEAQEIVKILQSTPVAVAFNSLFIILGIVILAGAIQMLRLKTRGFAFTASILAMLNIGSCCCILGLPIGIWSVVVLSKPEVKALFKHKQ